MKCTRFRTFKGAKRGDTDLEVAEIDLDRSISPSKAGPGCYSRSPLWPCAPAQLARSLFKRPRRGISKIHSRESILELLDQAGSAQKYNFVFIPAGRGLAEIKPEVYLV